MTDRIKAHMDSLFIGAPPTRRVEEMKQELLAGCLDKYEDLAGAQGMNPEDAYRKVVDGIGDVDELLGHIERIDTFDPRDAEEKRRKRAFFTSAGICCYFLAVAMWIALGYMAGGAVGFACFVVFAGIGTMLIVFGTMTTVIHYEKADDTMVEELKMQMTRGKRENKLAGLASSTLWSLVVVVYLLVSFLSFRWDVTWIIFPLAAAVQCGISAWFFPESRGKSLWGAYWCLVTVIYFAVSFWSFHWHITWMIFVLAVAVQQAVRLYSFWRQTE